MASRIQISLNRRDLAHSFVNEGGPVVIVKNSDGPFNLKRAKRDCDLGITRRTSGGCVRFLETRSV